jgi:hypothetical protein
MTPTQLAKYIMWMMIGTALIWIIADLGVYLWGGNATTESASIWRYSYTIPGIPYLCGILFGHLFMEMRPPSTQTVWHGNWFEWGRFVWLVLIAGYTGYDIYLYNTVGTVSALTTFIWAWIYHQVWIVACLGIMSGILIYQMDEATEIS